MVINIRQNVRHFIVSFPDTLCVKVKSIGIGKKNELATNLIFIGFGIVTSFEKKKMKIATIFEEIYELMRNSLINMAYGCKITSFIYIALVFMTKV